MQSILTIWKRGLALTFVLATWTCPGFAKENPLDWKTGSDFRRQLDSTIGFQWESNPVQTGLQALASNQLIAIWLDRRVDPGRLIDLVANDVSLDEALHRIGAAVEGGVCYVGSVAYIGSTSVTARLATIAAIRRDEVKRMPTAARSRFAAKSVSKWESLSTPRELLNQLAEEANVKIVDIEQIPHDLWPARDLPALPWTDRMTLVLAGFELTFETASDGFSIRFVPMPSEVAIVRRYSPDGSLNKSLSKIEAAIPGVEIKKIGGRIAVQGTLEQHEAIERLLRGEPTRRVKSVPGSKRYDLRVDNQPIGAILQVIAQREMLEVKVDTAIQSKLQERVSFEVKQLTRDQLLERILKMKGIGYRINDGVLELRQQEQ